jgi:hypothetical protein
MPGSKGTAGTPADPNSATPTGGMGGTGMGTGMGSGTMRH